MNVLYNLDNAYSFNGNTTAFVEIEDGVNEYGLGIGLTFIPVKKVKPGFNVGILVRYLLEKCKNVTEAIQEIHRLPIASGGTLTLADRTGSMVLSVNMIGKQMLIQSGLQYMILKIIKYLELKEILLVNLLKKITDLSLHTNNVTYSLLILCHINNKIFLVIK